jgi:hypothetical protein
MPMPYTLSKGPILAVLEDLLNPETPAEIQRLCAGLVMLREGVPLTEIGLVDSTNIKVEASTPEPLDERLNEYWFGKEEDEDTGEWEPQPPFGPRHHTTGYWSDYYGDVENILRETMIRTIEVSLGIDAGGDPAQASRHWDVEVFWKCGNPWVEGWVTWRRNRRHRDEGQVTTIIATPTDTKNQIRTHPARPPHRAAPLEVPKAAPQADHGMWLVTQPEHHRRTPHPDRVNSTSPILLARESWYDEGEVTTLELTEAVGGAAPRGLAYMPPRGGRAPAATKKTAAKKATGRKPKK